MIQNMKYITTSFLFCILFLAASSQFAQAQEPGFAWAASGSAPVNSTMSYGYGITFDSRHNVIATGICSDSTQFGNLQLTPGGAMTFVAKYDVAGKLLWAIPIRG